MPLNAKGKSIKAAMMKEYGPEKGEKVFYASENGGTIHGVTKKGGETEHHVHVLHRPGSIVHVHHHYDDGASVVHHHYKHPQMTVNHVHHKVDPSAVDAAGMEAKASAGLQAAFPVDTNASDQAPTA
jgi:hypothetical protein